MSNTITTKIAAFNGTTSEGTLTARSAKNCTVTRAGAGVFNVTMTGPASADPTQRIVHVSVMHTAELAWTVTDGMTEEEFQILFEINDGTATDPARFGFKVERNDNALQ